MKKMTVLALLFISSIALIGCSTKSTINSRYQEKIIYSNIDKDSIGSNDDDDIKEVEVERDVTTIVHVELNYDRFIHLDKNMITDDNVDDIIKMNRELGKKHHQARNEEIAKELGLDKEDKFYSSSYSPFITLELDVTGESEVYSRLEKYALSNDVKVIYADVVYSNEIRKDIDVMFEEIGLGTYSSYTDYSGYDGSGVVIGILEYGPCVVGDGGILDDDHANFTGIDLIVRSNICNGESEHATLVASIAGGNYGIARGAELLSVQTDGISYVSEFDWMIDNDVNVVNMSFSDGGSDGYYTGNARYLDYIVRDYWITIVKSAGNNGYKIGSPGTGYNIITVGALDYDTDILYSGSAWEEKFSISKPNLVAPGDWIRVGTSIIGRGTSYSAPHVTGAIALMMDKSSFLKAHPEIVIPIIQANSDISDLESTYNDFDSSGLEEKVGSGMLRVDRSMDNIYSRSLITLYNNNYYHTNLREISINLSSGDEFQASLFSLKNLESTPYGLTVLDHTNLNFYLYDPSGWLVAYSTSSDYNQEFIRYTANTTGTFKLKVYQYGEYETTTGTEYIGLAYWTE